MADSAVYIVNLCENLKTHFILLKPELFTLYRYCYVYISLCISFFLNFFLIFLQLRLSLKQRRQIIEPSPLLQHQQQLLPFAPPACNRFSIFKWLKKLLHLSNKKQKGKDKVDKVPNKAIIPKQVCDELLLVILPDQHYEMPTETDHQKTKTKLYRLAEKRVTQRRHRRRTHNHDTLDKIANNNYNYNNNCIRRRRKEAPLRNSVRSKLATLLEEMNVRYEKEYNLTRQLTEKCKQYKLQNELYQSPEMELSVGQLQRNIEAYADDIIKTEHELLELKQEIKQDISLINNLKRMTLEQDRKSDPSENIERLAKTKSKEITSIAKNTQEMQFVDNIYEFCDNNASMLV